jgi:hypothetical protein
MVLKHHRNHPSNFNASEPSIVQGTNVQVRPIRKIRSWLAYHRYLRRKNRIA